MSQMLTKEGTVSQKPSFKYTKSEKQTLENALKFDSLNNVLFPDTAKKFDASETVFLREQLTEMLKPIIEMWIPDYTARTVFPVRSMGAYGLDTVKYAEETWTGRALQAGKKQSGMPMVGESVNPTYVPVKHFELGADFSIYELRNAIYANYPLQAKKLEHAKTGQELALNDCVWGISPNSEDSVIPGLANQTAKLILSSDNSALTNFNILDNAKTGTEIYDFIMGAVSAPFAFTKKIMSQPDTLCLAPDQYNRVTSKRIGLTVGDTVANAILANSSIKRIIPCPELAAMTYDDNSTGDGMLVGRMTPDILEMVNVVNFTVLPTDIEHGTRFVIPTTQSFAGLFIYKKALALVKNTGA